MWTQYSFRLRARFGTSSCPFVLSVNGLDSAVMATSIILSRRKTKFMIQFYKDLSYDALSTELRQVGPLPCATAAEAAIGNSEIIAAVNVRHPKSTLRSSFSGSLKPCFDTNLAFFPLLSEKARTENRLLVLSSFLEGACIVLRQAEVRSWSLV